jgi:branched-chain amino acid aminotransferase
MTEKIGGAGFPARGVAYLDGQFLPMEEAKISIATHAFNYGTGCFEGIRGYWNSEREEIYLIKLQHHFRRLLNSARLFRIDIALDVDHLCDIAIELVRQGNYREDVYIRPIAYKASPVIKVGLLHLQDAFCCFTAPMGEYFDITKGLSVTVSGWRRNDDNAIPARAKVTGGYANAALAIADAQAAGFDEAITRGGVIELADKLGYPLAERRVDRTELYVADEIFLCGTGVQVAPVTKVDGRVVGDGKMGEITRAIQDRYLAAVHGDAEEEFQDWLTPVYRR